MNLNSRNKSQINVDRRVHKRIKEYALEHDLFLEEATERIFRKGMEVNRSFTNMKPVDPQAALTMLVVPIEVHDWIKAQSEYCSSQRFVAESILREGLHALNNEALAELY